MKQTVLLCLFTSIFLQNNANASFSKLFSTFAEKITHKTPPNAMPSIPTNPNKTPEWNYTQRFPQNRTNSTLNRQCPQYQPTQFVPNYASQYNENHSQYNFQNPYSENQNTDGGHAWYGGVHVFNPANCQDEYIKPKDMSTQSSSNHNAAEAEIEIPEINVKSIINHNENNSSNYSGSYSGTSEIFPWLKSESFKNTKLHNENHSAQNIKNVQKNFNNISLNSPNNKANTPKKQKDGYKIPSYVAPQNIPFTQFMNNIGSDKSQFCNNFNNNLNNQNSIRIDGNGIRISGASGDNTRIDGNGIEGTSNRYENNLFFLNPTGNFNNVLGNSYIFLNNISVTSNCALSMINGRILAERVDISDFLKKGSNTVFFDGKNLTVNGQIIKKK